VVVLIEKKRERRKRKGAVRTVIPGFGGGLFDTVEFPNDFYWYPMDSTPHEKKERGEGKKGKRKKGKTVSVETLCTAVFVILSCETFLFTVLCPRTSAVGRGGGEKEKKKPPTSYPTTP